MARMVQCVKLGREAEGLELPPLPGELGKNLLECFQGSLGTVEKTSDHVSQ